MIAPLRKTHRRTFAVLVFLLPLMFFTGLASRHPPAPAPAPALLDGIASRSGVFVVRVAESLQLQVEARELHPDPLLYWSETTSAEELPAGAQLLGPPESGARYRLPRAGGYVILYSGGHQRVVDYARLGALP